MTRWGIVTGMTLVAMLIFAAAQPAAAQTELTPTYLTLSADPPTSPWSIEGVGDQSEGNVAINLCWEDPGLNPQEGAFEATLSKSADPPEVSLTLVDSTHTFVTGATSTGSSNEEPACAGSMVLDLLFEVTAEFEGTIDASWDLTLTAEPTGDTGTFGAPTDETTTMGVELEVEEDIFGSETDTETEDEEAPAPEAEDSPAPALLVFIGIAAAVVSLIRRRR